MFRMFAFLLFAATDVAASIPDYPLLMPTDVVQRGRFGESVAASGNTVVVGAPWVPGNGLQAGAVYIFAIHRGEESFRQQAKLTANDGSAEAHFGNSVAIAGDVLVAGASNERSGGPFSGAAYVFEQREGAWHQVSKLLASDRSDLDFFGEDVATDGKTIVVGAPHSVASPGAVYVYQRQENGWNQRAKLISPSPVSSADWFGRSVAVENDVIVVGAPYDNETSGYRSGAAFVFRNTNGKWTFEGKLAPRLPNSGDFFGGAVSLAQGMIVVGAYAADGDPGAPGSGSAYVFKQFSGAWTEVAKLSPLDPSTRGFGTIVDTDGTRILVGTNCHNGQSAAVRFTWQEESWAGEQLVAGSGRSRFCETSVAIGGDFYAIGASCDESIAPATGTVFVYARDRH